MDKASTTANVAATRTMAQPRSRFLEIVMNLLRNTEFIIFLLVIVLLIIGGIVNPNFLNLENLKIMSRDVAILAIVAIGVGFPILTAGIDLSVGSMVGFGGVMVAWFMMRVGLPIWLSILMTLFLGFLVGSVHGLFVTKLKMHGFLITLVTFGAARGFILVLTDAFPITGLPQEFNAIGQGYLFNVVPIPVVICLLMAAAAYYLLRFTYIGRQIYAAGGNIEAARYSGVNVDARIILCYIVSGLCAVTVGMIVAARLTIGHPGSGEGEELLAIAACILGGVSFMGGEGSVLGMLIGATLIATLQNEMVMVNINPYWHKIVISMVLLLAVTFDYVRRRRRA